MNYLSKIAFPRSDVRHKQVHARIKSKRILKVFGRELRLGS